MSSIKTYSVEEITNLTVADIQDQNLEPVFEVTDWENLTPETREQCISKLRELETQKDALAFSSVVDANALTDKLNQIQRSRSATPVLPPWEPDDPEGTEKESYEALIKDNGRPCYPIELGFDVFQNPGQYKDILEYWQLDLQTAEEKLVFTAQLRKWESFRRIQQGDRRNYVSRGWFHKFLEFVRERRRKHGLDGDVQFREQVAEQSKLDDWMEYQNHKLREYEDFEETLKKVKDGLNSERKALTEEGFSAFEEFEGLNFGEYLSMIHELGNKEEKAEKKQELAKRMLRIAKKRLETAQSENLGRKVGRERWIDFFDKEVRSQQRRVNESKHLADEAKRDEEPYNQWWLERTEENETSEEEYHLPLPKRKIMPAEHQTKFDEMKRLRKRAYEARFAHFCAGEELEVAKELLETARTEDLAPMMEQAALIKRTQKEVRFAEFHLGGEEESAKVLDLKAVVIGTLYSITKLQGKIKQHEVLLDWIERQRRELIGDGSRTLSGSLDIEASNVDYAAKKCPRPQKPSILDPVDSGKVIKTPKQKGKRRRKASIPRDTSRTAEKTSADFQHC